KKLDFANAVCLYCRPFRGAPQPAQWLGMIDRLLALQAKHGIQLVVVDPLALFLPGRNESSAALMREALVPLRRLPDRGACVLLLQHRRKGVTPPGQAARGSGALAAFVDIIIEMDKCSRADSNDRRRRLRTYSRFEQTTRQLVIELNP